MSKLLSLLLITVLFTPLVQAKPLVIAHRGASGYLPEHTLEAATLAYAQGANYIEQDLVVSKDGVLVVLHDIHLDTVTNVASQYPARKRADGRYYVIDFTLAELKNLRVHERQTLDGKQVFGRRYQGQAHFQIATFEEQIELIAQLNRQFGKTIGLYPEIKSPKWHKSQGVDISVLVLEILRKHQLDSAEKNIFVQCFDFAETKRLRQELGAKVKLVQLVGENDWQESPTDYTYLRTAQGLKDIAKVAQGIGPWIPQIVDLQKIKSTGLVEQAQKLGLAVHPYTYRQDALPKNATAQQALDVLFKQLKVDGIFSDFTDTVVTYLKATQAYQKPESATISGLWQHTSKPVSIEFDMQKQQAFVSHHDEADTAGLNLIKNLAKQPFQAAKWTGDMFDGYQGKYVAVTLTLVDNHNLTIKNNQNETVLALQR